MPSALGMPPLSYGSRAVLDARRLIIDWGKYNYTALEINEGIDRPPPPPPPTLHIMSIFFFKPLESQMIGLITSHFDALQYKV